MANAAEGREEARFAEGDCITVAAVAATGGRHHDAAEAAMTRSHLWSPEPEPGTSTGSLDDFGFGTHAARTRHNPRMVARWAVSGIAREERC